MSYEEGNDKRGRQPRDGAFVETCRVIGPPDADSAPVCLVETLVQYCQYRQRGDLDGLRQRYPELARIVGEAVAAPTTDD